MQYFEWFLMARQESSMRKWFFCRDLASYFKCTQSRKTVISSFINSSHLLIIRMVSFRVLVSFILRNVTNFSEWFIQPQLRERLSYAEIWCLLYVLEAQVLVRSRYDCSVGDHEHLVRIGDNVWTVWNGNNGLFHLNVTKIHWPASVALCINQKSVVYVTLMLLA